MNKHILKTKQKEDDILNAVEYLISTQPLDHITINEIKTSAKVSQVTIYKLFGTKENLILTAIKHMCFDAVNAILKIIKSDICVRERLQEYFRTSFNIALLRPRQRAIIEYIFSGGNEELAKYVLSLYQETYPYLEKLYLDGRKNKIIRKEITKEQFYKMCDMYTRITPDFYQTTAEMEIIIKSIVLSFG